MMASPMNLSRVPLFLKMISVISVKKLFRNMPTSMGVIFSAREVNLTMSMKRTVASDSRYGI